MTTVAISKFKAKCLALLERVVTRHGEPVAQVLPPPLPDPSEGSAFGAMAGTAEELGDIVELMATADWEALR